MKVPRKKGRPKGEAPIKICTTCYSFNFVASKKCTYCNTTFQMEKIK